MRQDIYHELTRRDHYRMAVEAWALLEELEPVEDTARWLAGLVPPLEDGTDERIARVLTYRVWDLGGELP